MSLRKNPKAYTLRWQPTAWQKFMYLCSRASGEIGGFGIVNDPEEDLLIQDFELSYQTTTATTTRPDESKIGEMDEALAMRGFEPFQWARIWIHTQPGMGVEPSSQDWETFYGMMDAAPWGIMLIVDPEEGEQKAWLGMKGPCDSYMTVNPTVSIDWLAGITPEEAVVLDGLYEERVTEQSPPSKEDWLIPFPRKTGGTSERQAVIKKLEEYGYSERWLGDCPVEKLQQILQEEQAEDKKNGRRSRFHILNMSRDSLMDVLETECGFERKSLMGLSNQELQEKVLYEEGYSDEDPFESVEDECDSVELRNDLVAQASGLYDGD